MTHIFISILNWNNAANTLDCVGAIHQTITPNDVSRTLVVLDNGSRPDDWTALQQGLADRDVTLLRQETNIGFAAGHNVVIRQAMERKADYIWLLNNDAIVKPDTLAGLLHTISGDPACGVVSPLIYAHYNEKIIDFVGAVHCWSALSSHCAKDRSTAIALQKQHPADFFVYGTAPLFRLNALKMSGLLDESFFAYFEDDDICSRLSQLGWHARMAFNTEIRHGLVQSFYEERPPYYFYLMARNDLIFYWRHTPPAFRRLIRLRIFSRAMIKAAQLRERGLPEKSNACLLGIWDGLRGQGGPPRLNAKAPAWLVFISAMFPYRFQQWLDRT